MKEKIRDIAAHVWFLLSSKTGILLLLGLICGIVGVFEPLPALWALVWICAFTAFDVYVYPATSTNDEQAYRIGQAILWIFLSLAIYKTNGWVALRSAWLFWYFLGCDYLYIWMRKEKLRPFTYWDLNVFVFYFKYIKKQSGAPIAWANVSAALAVILFVLSLIIQ